MKKSLNILHVEDDTAEAVLLQEKLRTSERKDELTITRTDCITEAEKLLKKENSFNAVVLDLNLVDSAGTNSVRAIKNICRNLPIIVLTGMSDELAISEALQQGAQEYFIKGEEDGKSLKRAIRHSIERINLESRLFAQAAHDDLTGLASRNLFLDCLRHASARSDRSSKPFALLYIDLDDFKIINDTYGHSIGDKLLKEVSRRLEKCVRECDTVARLGGDEFAIILEDLSEKSRSEVERVLGRISMQIAGEPYEVSGKKRKIGVSIGIAMYPDNGRDPKDLLKVADTYMYKAKKSSDMVYCFAEQSVVD